MYLCGNAIIPTLFPFLILTDLLLSSKSTRKLLDALGRPLSKIFHLSAAGGTVFLLGALFGFPMGAKAIARYYPEGRISKEEAERLLLFSGNASPFFLIGSVGTEMLSSSRMGVALYLLQLSVSVSCGILLGILAPRADFSDKELPYHEKKSSFPAAVRGAVKQSLFISGYILFFSAVLSMTLPYLPHPFLKTLFSSLLEIGNACALAANDKALALPFCAFGACFSGLSVYFQVLDCIEETDLDIKRYIPIKLLCGTAGFFLALLPFFR
ncbi:MAG: hypothetical protein E7609_00805 [Ruminococcaceae bacterium]|nr:hypothetical protein [Oscillospiraceae bacterium]